MGQMNSAYTERTRESQCTFDRDRNGDPAELNITEFLPNVSRVTTYMYTINIKKTVVMKGLILITYYRLNLASHFM